MKCELCKQKEASAFCYRLNLCRSCLSAKTDLSKILNRLDRGKVEILLNFMEEEQCL